MLLIHPPVSKPCEPPPGIARLFSFLTRRGIKCHVLDANLEGLLAILAGSPSSFDTWTTRAFRSLPGHLSALRNGSAYKKMSRYTRAVMDLNRVLTISARDWGVRLSLANYQHKELSPAKSADLIRAWEHPEENLFYPFFKGRLLGLMESEQPSLAGFSLNYLSQALCTFAMMGFLRKEWPGVKLALGGGLVTSWMRSPGWLDPFQGLVDHLVAGPGEYPLLSLAGGERVAEEGHCPPDYRPFPTENHLAPGLILPYSSSTGCYWSKCSFCPERAEGNPYSPIPADLALGHLHSLCQEMEPVLVHLLDNAIRPEMMQAISENPFGVPWYGFVRVTHHLMDIDFCLSLKKSGCRMLKIGLESGDQELLDKMQKGIDLKMASLALQTLKKAGIATYVYLLFGTPEETLAGARKTLDFMARHWQEISFLNLAVFNLPRHSPDSRKFETRQFYEGDLSLYTGFSHPKGWDRNLVRQFLDKEFKRHPAVASILRRDPPVFTSNHAPFFVRE